MDHERLLLFWLRIVGSASLLALVFVPFPYSGMDAIHRALGMGELPNEPVVLYLARSTSAFYALMGGLMWVLSFDMRRHRAVLVYLGAALTAFGVVLTVVDWVEGLPMFWKLGEGPADIVIGLIILLLGRGLGDETSAGASTEE